MSRTSKVPLYTGRKEDQGDYLDSLNNSLFTRPTFFTPTVTGLTGDPSGILVSTGRHCDVSITIKGPTLSSPGTLQVPVNPVLNIPMSAVSASGVFLGYAFMSSVGILNLPTWNESGDVVVFGSAVEG